jgi:hypothetical protein
MDFEFHLVSFFVYEDSDICLIIGWRTTKQMRPIWKYYLGIQLP